MAKFSFLRSMRLRTLQPFPPTTLRTGRLSLSTTCPAPDKATPICHLPGTKAKLAPLSFGAPTGWTGKGSLRQATFRAGTLPRGPTRWENTRFAFSGDSSAQTVGVFHCSSAKLSGLSRSTPGKFFAALSPELSLPTELDHDSRQRTSQLGASILWRAWEASPRLHPALSWDAHDTHICSCQSRGSQRP